MSKKLAVWLLAAAASLCVAVNWTWKTMKIGAGGYITAVDIAPDGTRVMRTDTYGAYKWNTTTEEWEQLLSTNSIPTADWNTDGSYNGDPGVYEIKIAPSDSDTMYMVFAGKVFKTTDGGDNWTKTNFTAQTDMNPNDWHDLARMWTDKMAIHPTDDDYVYVGTVSNGLQYTKDGGTTWNKALITAPSTYVPDGIDGPGISGICFDTDNSNTVYAASRGNGVYRTTNANLATPTWSKITTGGDPQHVFSADCYKGQYYIVETVHTHNTPCGICKVDQGAPMKWTGSTWTSMTAEASPSGRTIVGDINADDVCTGSGTPTGWSCCTDVDTGPCKRLALLTQNGELVISRDDGSNWDSEADWDLTSPNIPWHDDVPHFSVSAMSFDPNGDPGELYLAQGRGVWTGTLPDAAISGDFTWTETSVGIEQTVVNDIIAPPEGTGTEHLSAVHACVYDFGTFSFPWLDVDEYPDEHGTTSANQHCVGIDYVATDSSNPKIVAFSYKGGTQYSRTSTDRGDTWDDIANLSNATNYAGTVAASTNTNFYGHLGVNDGIYVTTDPSTSWTNVSAFGDDLHFRTWINRHIVAADHVTEDKAWVYYVNKDSCPGDSDTGIWRTTDAGANWTQIHSSVLVGCGYDIWNGTLRTAPGKENHLWWTPGGSGGGNPDTNAKLVYSTDGGCTAPCTMTWNDIDNVREIKSFGFGSTASGASYPRMYIAGWVDTTGTPTWTWGIWYTDNADHSSGGAQNPTWTKIGTHPTGRFDKVMVVEGDKSGEHHERVYVGYRGSGVLYGEPYCGTYDQDSDGVDDVDDNCVFESYNSGSQYDSDSDGYGNACDCDFDNNGYCGITDFTTISNAWGKSCTCGSSCSGPPCTVCDAGFNHEADMDGNCGVGVSDWSLFVAPGRYPDSAMAGKGIDRCATD